MQNAWHRVSYQYMLVIIHFLRFVSSPHFKELEAVYTYTHGAKAEFQIHGHLEKGKRTCSGMRLEFFSQPILLTKSLFPLFWGAEEFSSPLCIVVGRIHADTKWDLQDRHGGSANYSDQLPF